MSSTRSNAGPREGSFWWSGSGLMEIKARAEDTSGAWPATARRS
jgi:hypothetical protein